MVNHSCEHVTMNLLMHGISLMKCYIMLDFNYARVDFRKWSFAICTAFQVA